MDEYTNVTALNEFPTQFPDLRGTLSKGLKQTQLKYISENRTKPNEEVARDLKLPTPIVTFYKLKFGIEKVTEKKILDLSRELSGLSRRGGKNRRLENITNEVYLSTQDVAQIDVCLENIPTLRTNTETKQVDSSKVKTDTYYKITQIMGLTGLTSQKINEGITSGNISYHIIKHPEEEEGRRIEMNIQKRFPEGTYLIRGQEIINFVTNSKHFNRTRSEELTRNFKIKRLTSIIKRELDCTKPESITRDNFTSLLNEVSHLSLLTKEEEEFLGNKVKSGNSVAISDMIESNLRYVAKFALKYERRTRHLKKQDHFQQGIIGLYKAILKFDPNKGFKFSTYANWWIKEEIERNIANKEKTIRNPVHVYEKINKINIFNLNFFNEKGREPTIDEIHKGTKIERGLIKRVLNEIHEEPFSLDQDSNSSEHDPIKKYLEEKISESPEDEIIREDERNKILELIGKSKLSERDKRIISLRFGLEAAESLTLDEIAKEIGVTRERVRQIQKESLKKLKIPFEKEMEL